MTNLIYLVTAFDFRRQPLQEENFYNGSTTTEKNSNFIENSPWPEAISRAWKIKM